MATTIRVQIEIPGASAIPEDKSVNTWHCYTSVSGGAVAAATAFITDLQTFYGGLGNFYSSETVGTPWRARAYDLSLAKPAGPIYEQDFGPGLYAGDGYPRELAICLSYRAHVAPGDPPARRRGRVFLGPILASLGETVSGDRRVKTTTRNLIAAKAGVLVAAANDSTLYKWVVYSPTDDAGNGTRGDLAPRSVTGGWVDNAFDIQRRRGSRATERAEWGFPKDFVGGGGGG